MVNPATTATTQAPDAPDEARIGSLFAGRYRLEGIVGRSEIDVTYAATHEWTGRAVLVKLLTPARLRHCPGATERWLVAARARAGVSDPGMLEVLDMGAENGTLYVAFEHLEGVTLSTLLAQQGLLGTETALEIVAPILDAVARGHRRGVHFPEINPDDVLLTNDATGRPIAKLTTIGVAFEEGEPVHDVAILGALLYKMLSGARPSYAPGETRGPVPLATRSPHVRRSIANVIDRSLARDCERAYASVEELVAALRYAAEGRSSEYPLPEPSATRSVWTARRAVAAFLLSLLCGGALVAVGIAVFAPEPSIASPTPALAPAPDPAILGSRGTLGPEVARDGAIAAPAPEPEIVRPNELADAAPPEPAPRSGGAPRTTRSPRGARVPPTGTPPSAPGRSFERQW